MHNGLLHRVPHNSNTNQCQLAIVHMILIWLHQNRHSLINRKLIGKKISFSKASHFKNELEITHIFLYVLLYSSETFALYRISYMWYTTFGALTTMIVAGLGTFITGASDATLVDLKLLAPCMRKYLEVNDEHIRKQPKKSHPNENVIPEVDEDSVDADKESTL